MDFRSSVEDIAAIEKNAAEYKPAKGEAYKAERQIEMSPQEILDMGYDEAINQYGRIEKIISASSMDVGLIGTGMRAEAPSGEVPQAETTPEGENAAAQMRSISAASARESEILTKPKEERPAISLQGQKPAAPQAPAQKAQPAGGAAAAFPEEEKAPAAPVSPVSAPSPSSQLMRRKMPREEAPSEEKEMQKKEEFLPEAPAPIIEKMPPAPPREFVPPAPREKPGAPLPEIAMPPILSESPERSADATINRLEQQFQAQFAPSAGKAAGAGKKVDTEGAKKRMMELTRELFRERSFDRREEIKKEIVLLKNMIADAGVAPKSGAGAGAPAAGAFLTALKGSQDYEFSAAKKSVQESFESNLKALTSQMEMQVALEKKAEAVDSFERNAVSLEQRLITILEKYQIFLTAKHNAELSALSAKGLSSADSEKMRETLRDRYAHEFASIKHTIGEEIHSKVQNSKETLTESAGDPKARGIAQVNRATEEELLNLLQSGDPRQYEKYARGELSRAEALASARRRMAAQAGLDEDTINTHFGGK